MITPVLLAFLGASACAEGLALPTVNLGYQVHRAISFDKQYQTYNFTNIPYAEPPLGPLRFQAPVPVNHYSPGIQDGKTGKICPQAAPRWLDIGFGFATAFAKDQLPFNYTKVDNAIGELPPVTEDPRVTEDCLVLDVIVPKAVLDRKNSGIAHDRSGAPVIVWIFGGGYVIGDKAMSGTPHDLLAVTKADGGNGAIWVSMNYRLGAFGFLAGPTLQGNGTANAGLYDQRLAIEWVRDHIHKFGGDPDNITIMGVSAGGGSVMHQITAYGGLKPVAFRRAITQSAGFVPIPGPQQQENAFSSFLSLLNVSSLEDARALPSDKLRRANALQVWNAPFGTFVFGPSIDNYFVPGPATKLLQHGSFATNVSILSSYMRYDGVQFTDPRGITDEAFLKRQLQGFFPRIEESSLEFVLNSLYPPVFSASNQYSTSLERVQTIIGEAGIMCNHNAMLEAATRQGRTARGYIFTIPPALHGADQPYIFSNGPTNGVDTRTSHLIKQSIAEFVMGTIVSTLPEYGSEKVILELALNSTKIVRDAAASDRCDWWQKALYY